MISYNVYSIANCMYISASYLLKNGLRRSYFASHKLIAITFAFCCVEGFGT